jgi:hypothetical protein
MSVDAKHTSHTPIPPAPGEFDLLRETAGHPLQADLVQRAIPVARVSGPTVSLAP